MPWSQISVTWLGVVHFLACLSPQLGSVLYHLFMNHEGGEPVYKKLLTLDMCGICMITTLGKSLSTDRALFIIIYVHNNYRSPILYIYLPVLVFERLESL